MLLCCKGAVFYCTFVHLNKNMKYLQLLAFLVFATFLGAQTADLSLTSTATSVYPQPFTLFSVVVTLTNNGPSTATNISLTRFYNLNAAVAEGNNEGSVTSGVLNCAKNCWNIPSLNAGQSTTWTMNFFSLGAGQTDILFVHVDGLTQDDPDSDTSVNDMLAPFDDDELAIGFNQEPPTGGSNLPDLIVTALGADNDSLVSNVYQLFHFTIANTGNAVAPLASSQGNFVLCTTPVYQPSTVVFNNYVYFDQDLGANQTKDIVLNFYLPTTEVYQTYYAFVLADRNDDIVESNETNNVSPVFSFVMTPPVLPNLKLLSETYPITLTAGATPSVNLKVKNTGFLGSIASITRIYLSTDSLSLNSSILIKEINTPALIAGATANHNTTLPVPANLSGTYYWITYVDNSYANNELNEFDNRTWEQVTISGTTVLPNLQFLAAATVTPATTPSYASVQLNFTVKNNATVACASSTGRIYLSSNASFSADDVLINTFSTPILAANGTMSYNISAFLPFQAVVGTKYIILRADDASLVAESSETNNTKVLTITTTAVPADMIMYSVSGSFTGNPTVDSSTVYMYGTYQGQSKISPKEVAWYYSLDTVLGSGDLLIGKRMTDSLAFGDIINLSQRVVIPVAAPNTTNFYLICKLDNTAILAEISETNNTAHCRVSVDFLSYVNSISMFFDWNTNNYIVEPGTTILSKLLMVNAGNRSFNQAPYRYYLSTNDQFDAGDLAISNLFQTGPLLFLFSTTWVTSDLIYIPTTISAGNYYILVVNDPNNATVESDETNNTKSIGPITIGSIADVDLRLQSINTPNTLQAGDNVSMSVTVKNFGQLGSAETYCYLTLSYDSLSLGNSGSIAQVVIPALAPGQATTQTLSVSVPYAYVGSLYLVGSVVSSNNEYNLFNNQNYRSVTLIDPRPDLVMQNLQVVQTGPTQVTATFQVRNIGLLTAPSADVGMGIANLAYITTNFYNTNQVGTTSSLAPNAVQSFNINFALPDGLLDTTYKFIVEVNTSPVNFAEAGSSFNNFEADSVYINATQPNYTYNLYGSGTGVKLRKLPNGGYQIIAKDNAATPNYSLVYTDAAGSQTAVYPLGTNVFVTFSGADGFASVKKSNSTILNLKVYNAGGVVTINKNHVVGTSLVLTDIIALNAGGFAISGNLTAVLINNTIQTIAWVMRVNAAGNLLWAVEKPSTFANGSTKTLGLTQTNSNTLALDGSEIYPLDNYGYGYSVNRKLQTLNLSNGADGVVMDSLAFYSNYSTTYTLDNPSGFLEPVSTNQVLWGFGVPAFGSSGSSVTIGNYLVRSPNLADFFYQTYYYSAYYQVLPSEKSLQHNYGVEPTSDGGYLMTSDIRTAMPQQKSLVRVNPDNTLAWERTGPGPMQDMITVGSDVFALTGSKNGQICLVFIDANGENTDPNNTAQNGMDLSLDVQVSNPTPTQYANVPVKIVVTNQGNQTCTQAIIKATWPAHPAIALSSSAVSEGSFNTASGEWTIPAGFAPGETDTLTLTLFTLTLNNQTIYAQVQTASPADLDSSPNNGTCCTPIEDDEDAGTINPPGGTSLMALVENTPLTIESVHPNPAQIFAQVVIQSAKTGAAQLTIIDMLGRKLLQKTLELEAGTTTELLDLQSFESGLYLVVIHDETGSQSSIMLAVEH
jgi:subtilase family serine protease